MGWLFNEDNLVSQPVSHIAAYFLHKNIRVTAVCDIDKERLSGASKRYGIKKTYTDYRKMLSSEDLDVVSICVPTPLHSKVGIEAAESGVRAIFCEKPIATSIEEADYMIKACKKNNVRLVVNHTRRWDASSAAVKNILDKHVVGRVDLVTAFAPAGLLNSGTHLFDLLRYYFGEVKSVSGTIISDRSTDPGARGIIKFKKGEVCFIDSSFRDYLLFAINIYGDRGMINIGGKIRDRKAFTLLLGKKSKREVGIKELGLVKYKAPKWMPPILNAVNNILKDIEGKKAILCTGEDGKAALEIAMAFYESSQKHGEEIILPLRNKNMKIIPRETSFTGNGRLR